MLYEELAEDEASPGFTMASPSGVDSDAEPQANSVSVAHGITEPFTFPMSGSTNVFKGSRITVMPVCGGPPFYIISGYEQYGSNDDA